MTKVIRNIARICLLIMLFNNAYSQVSHSKLKAVFIYRFASNISWENESKFSNYTIAVYGSDPAITEALNEISGTNKLKNKKIRIKTISELSDINNVQALFVVKSENESIETIYNAIERKNILLITEECSDSKYIMLNLQYKEEGKYSFQINKANIIVENLGVEPELLLLGGTEIDVRELYREMKVQLQEEKQYVDTQRKVIEKQLLKIVDYQKGIDSLKQNSEELRFQIDNRESILNNLVDSIQLQQQILNDRIGFINKQKKEIEISSKQIKEQEIKINEQLHKLDNLSNEANRKESLIKRQGESISTHQTKIDLQKRIIILFVGLLVVIFALVISAFRAYRIKKQLSASLEQRVKERTSELEQSNKKLTKEITVRTIIEGELKKSERNYREIFNAASETIFIHDAKTGTILDANDSIRTMFGFEQHELGVIGLEDISQNEGEFTLKKFIGKIQLALTDGAQLFEWRAKRKNGEMFWAEIALKSALIGGTQKVLAVVRDITEKKKIEAELEKHRNHLEILVKERTDELTSINEELNATNEELYNANNQLNEQKLELEQALMKLQNAQLQLVQSEKMASLGVLTAGIAHEINNPVNFITSSIYGINNFIEGFNQMYNLMYGLLEKSKKQNLQELKQLNESLDFDFMREGVTSIVESISIGAERIANIVKGLRTFSHQDNKVKQLVDLNENLDITLTMLQHETKNKVEVIKEYNEIPKVNCMLGQINQVFMNILINAIQAIEEKGKITIVTCVCDENEFVCIKVKDTGKGFNEETKTKLFEPFYTTKKVGEGSGLGLYLSYNIINEHKGKIDVTSEQGVGTEFTIKLPLTN